MGVGNLAHFMYKITLFHQQQGGLKPEQGGGELGPLTLTTVHWRMGGPTPRLFVKIMDMSRLLKIACVWVQ